MIGSNILWSSKEVYAALGLKGESSWEANGISMDSRSINKGDLFFAIKGDQADGHSYVAEALSKGAIRAVVSRIIEGVDQDKLILVSDTLQAMQTLARAARMRSGATILGITGSVGKTGTKEFLAAAFSIQGQTHASSKSYNNHWGVPYSLSSMPAGTDYGVFEMGMNHAGEITPLALQVRPHIAIITTIEAVHVGNFETGLQGIADAKSEIMEGIEPGGKIILNRDNDWYDYLQRKAQGRQIDIYSFGEHPESSAVMIECIEASNGSRVKAKILGEEISFTLKIAGRHIVLNAIATLLAVKLAGGDINKAVQALSKIEPIAGRGKREFIDLGDSDNPVTLIDESYNANPAAMRAAFKVLALIDPGRGGRRIAILGDMLELGVDSARHHRDLALPLKAANVDLVYTCGKFMKGLHDALPANQRGEHRESSAELAKIVPDVLTPGDVVMVKGSLGSKMGIVVEALRALPASVAQKRKG